MNHTNSNSHTRQYQQIPAATCCYVKICEERWERYEVQKSILNGEIGVPGAKNSSLSLLAAACMAGEEVILENVPDILDVEVIKDIYDDINVTYTNSHGKLHINSTEI